MARWQCKNCAVVVDAGPFSGRIEDSIKEINAKDSSPCPVCDEKAGFDNLDYESTILVPQLDENLL
jgi:rubredoxin